MSNTQSSLAPTSSAGEIYSLLDSLGTSMLGFNRDWSRRAASCAQGKEGYPPYNLLKRKAENGNLQFIVEVACAGFSTDELNVSVEKDQLTISGKKLHHEDDLLMDQYLHRGIAKRKFALSFILERNVQVIGSQYTNGILSVEMEQIIPEEELPKRIEIKTAEPPALSSSVG